MKKIALIGGGVLGQQALEIHTTNPMFEIVAFYDDTIPTGSFICGIPVVGGLSAVLYDFELKKFDAICICIGYKHLPLKTELFERFKEIPLVNIIHRTAYIEKSAQLLGSNIIYANVYIGHRCVLQKGVIINIYSYLAHDVTIDLSAFLSGGVQIAGKVEIGRNVFIGIGVICIDELTIESNVFIGAGTVVIKSLDAGKYVGNPAKKIFQ